MPSVVEVSGVVVEVVELDVGVTGQQAPGLQLDEGGRDQQELRRHLEIEAFHLLELGDVGVDDAAQGDLVEVHLFVEDQVQQQVEGALEHRGLNLIGHGREDSYMDVVS